MKEIQYEASRIAKLEYHVAERANTDFITDPGKAVILSIITCGIYGLYIVYKLVQRRDQHFRRMADVVEDSFQLLKEKAEGREDLIADELNQLDQIRMRMRTMSAEQGAAIWLLICISTSWVFGGFLFVSIGDYILYYVLMKDYSEHDAIEARFFTLMSSSFARLGLAAEPGEAQRNVPERDYTKFLIWSIVTCGIYGLYWMYVMIKDFNEHFMMQVPWEDFILQALQYEVPQAAPSPNSL
jgi:Domain of unknown function (DUF4234)